MREKSQKAREPQSASAERYSIINLTTCPECGFHPPPGDLFCLNCGNIVGKITHVHRDGKTYLAGENNLPGQQQEEG